MLFYVNAINRTMLTALSAIAMEQANPTTKTIQNTKQILEYMAINTEAIVTYLARDMLLAVHGDASYLSKPKAWSRGGGQYFLP